MYSGLLVLLPRDVCFLLSLKSRVDETTPAETQTPSPGISCNQTDFSTGTASHSDARILFCIIRLHCFIALLSGLCFEGDFQISRSHKPSPSPPPSHTVRVSLIHTFLHHVVWQICPCSLSSRLAVWRQIFSKSRFSRVAAPQSHTERD